MSKPIIGLNADFVNAAGDKPAFTYIASGYYDAISKVGRNSGHHSPAGRR